MKKRTLLSLSLVLSTLTWAQEQHLFNGKDLTGWDGKPGWWTVEDGALTSESTPEKKCHKANYLVWTGGEPADFELNLDFKLSPNTPKANSGVQIRSERRPDWDTFGYQADMSGTGNLTGFVYHHGRGLIAARGENVVITSEGKRVVESLGDSASLNKHFRPGEWNHYRIVCQGPNITLYINDVLMCKFSDHDPKQARSKGCIALQMHPGPPMKIQFKNILLKSFVAAPSSDRENALIQILNSEAGPHEKENACRELAQIGSANAVPALKALLMDDSLSHMARYSLEAIPASAVNEALRSGLTQLEGVNLVGLIQSVGNRRDDEAVELLVPLLSGEDSDIRIAAASALGRIASDQAIVHLQAFVEQAEGKVEYGVYDALFESAERLFANGKREGALSLYESLRIQPDAPESVQLTAARASILLRGSEGMSRLENFLVGENDALAQTAIQALAEIYTPEMVTQITGVIDRVSPARQILLIGVLAATHDSEALSALLPYMDSQNPSLRLAAIRAVSEVGGDASVPYLINLVNDPDPVVAQATLTGLVGLRGAGVDELVLKRLRKSHAELQLKLVGVAAQRNLRESLPDLQVLMNDANDALRLAAIKSYGELAEIEQLPVLLDQIKERNEAKEVAALGKTIALLCIKTDDPNDCITQLSETMKSAVPEAQAMLRKVMKRMGVSEQ